MKIIAIFVALLTSFIIKYKGLGPFDKVVYISISV